MAESEFNYVRRRADAEVRLAEQAVHEDAKRAHRELANAYRARAERLTPMRIVVDA